MKRGFCDDIEELTVDNEDFRRVLYTGQHLQLVLMTLQPGEEIGEEVHEDRDQFFRIEEGEGAIDIDGGEQPGRGRFRGDRAGRRAPQRPQHRRASRCALHHLRPARAQGRLVHATKAEARSAPPRRGMGRRDHRVAEMPNSTDRVRFFRPERLPGLELVEVSYERRAFPVHSHEEYVIGVITRGREWLSIRGTKHTARPATSSSSSRASRMPMRQSTRAVSNIAFSMFQRAMVARRVRRCAFRGQCAAGQQLGRRWAALHRRMMSGAEDLELEGQFFALLGEILHAGGQPGAEPGRPSRPRSRWPGLSRHAFCRAGEPGDLAGHVGLEPLSSCCRSFRDQVGITPGAYQIQLRVLEARRRLRDGAGIAATATDLGFADQSHLTRHFQRIIGTSPGRYLQQ